MSYLETIGAVRSAEIADEQIHLKLYKIVNVPSFIRLFFRVKSPRKWGPITPLAEIIINDAQKMSIMFSRAIENVELTKKLTIPCSADSTKIELLEKNNQKNHRVFKLL